jgi:ABC-type Fe3+ transport system substrate-binding protein
MFDKKNAAKVKPIVDYALSAEGQKNCFRSWLHSIELIKLIFNSEKGCPIRQHYSITIEL